MIHSDLAEKKLKEVKKILNYEEAMVTIEIIFQPQPALCIWCFLVFRSRLFFQEIDSYEPHGKSNNKMG